MKKQSDLFRTYKEFFKAKEALKKNSVACVDPATVVQTKSGIFYINEKGEIKAINEGYAK